jgi:hypothetical protein
LHRKTGSAGKSISGRESERSQASPTERILEHQQDKKAMIPERITKGMEQQMANHPGGHYRVSDDRRKMVITNCETMGIPPDSELMEFCLVWNPGLIFPASGVYIELDSPDESDFVLIWEWGQELGLSSDFVPLTSFEGEGGIIWSKRDGRVYDAAWTEFQSLNDGKLAPRWESYYELIEHCLYGSQSEAQ